MVVYSGPVRPDTDESTYRETGISYGQSKESIPSSYTERASTRAASYRSSGGSSSSSKTTAEAAAKAAAEAAAKAAEEAKQIEEMRKAGAAKLAKQQADLQAKRTASSVLTKEQQIIQARKDYQSQIIKQTPTERIESYKQFQNKIQTIKSPKKEIIVVEEAPKEYIKGNLFFTGNDKEVYVSGMGAYASSPYGEGTGGTAFFRTPTPSEKINIESAGSLTNWVGEKIEEVREFSPIKKVREKFQGTTAYKKLQDLSEWEKSKRDYSPINTNQTSISALTTPEGIKNLFDTAAETTLKAGEKISSFLIDKKIVTDPTLTGPSPISRETAKEVISGAYMFSSFEPFMRTGTAATQVQESQYVYDYRKGRFVKKSDAIDYLKSPKVDISGKTTTIKDLTYYDKASRINELLAKATTDAQRKGILELAKEAYGQSFVKEFGAQEFGLMSIPKATTKPATTSTSLFSGSSGVQLKGISALETGSSIFGTSSAYAGTGQYEKTSFMSPKVKSKLDSKVDLLSGLKLDVKTKSKSKVGLATGLLIKTDQKIDSLFKIDSLSDIKQKYKQDSRVDVATAQLVQQIPVLKSEGVFEKGGQDIQNPKKETKIKVPISKKSSTKKKKVKAGAKSEAGYIAQVLEGKSWKTINPKKPITKAKAQALGQLVADKTIGATTRIKRTNKKPSGYFKGILSDAKKFRDYKIRAGKKVPQKNLWIEKRKFRLDHPKETQTLQAFRRSAEFKKLAKSRSNPVKKKALKKSARKSLFWS